MENFKKNGRKWEIKNNIPYKSEKFWAQQAKGPILVVLIKKECIIDVRCKKWGNLTIFSKSSTLFVFIRTKALVLVKKNKNTLRTKPGLLSRRT